MLASSIIGRYQRVSSSRSEEIIAAAKLYSVKAHRLEREVFRRRLITWLLIVTSSELAGEDHMSCFHDQELTGLARAIATWPVH